MINLENYDSLQLLAMCDLLDDLKFAPAKNGYNERIELLYTDIVCNLNARLSNDLEDYENRRCQQCEKLT